MKDIQRFIGLIEKNNGCWEWQGSLDKDGYGWFTLKGKVTRAHRTSYKLFVGEITPNQHLDHLCRNRKCVNPSHLEIVTPRENTLRSPIARAAINSRKTHCYMGHEFTPINTGYRHNGTERYCKTCINKNKKNGRSVIREPRVPKLTHCKHGHELDKVNLSYSKSGEWFCKRCVADRQKLYKDRLKAKS